MKKPELMVFSRYFGDDKDMGLGMEFTNLTERLGHTVEMRPVRNSPDGTHAKGMIIGFEAYTRDKVPAPPKKKKEIGWRHIGKATLVKVDGRSEHTND